MEILRRTASEPWPLNSGWGNHRAVVLARRSGEPVKAVIAWRRRDLEPEKIGVKIKHLETGEEILPVSIIKANREEGEIVFTPPYSGLYGIYYLPFAIEGKNWYDPEVCYMKAEDMPGGDEQGRILEGNTGNMSTAEVVAIESRTDFDGFDLMEIPATAGETKKLLCRHPDAAFVLFPEDRTRSVKMLFELPQCWIERGEGLSFNGKAQPGEYYVFQIGVWALKDLEDLQIVFEAAVGGRSLQDSAVTCFNTEGTDWLGNCYPRKLTVAAGSVQPLWFGVDLPEDAQGAYEFFIKLSSACGEKKVHVMLEVEGEKLANRGDGDLWRLSRLRWLNSAIGIDGEPAKGYPPVEVRGNRVSCLGREVAFDPSGLPADIFSFFTVTGDAVGSRAEAILAAPVEMKVVSGDRSLVWETGSAAVEKVASGRALIKADRFSSGLTASSHTVMEYDGHMDTVLTLTAERDLCIDNFQLAVSIRKKIAVYMMGMGKEGGVRPTEWQYRWDVDRPNNMVWIGSPHAGLQIKLKHTEDVWELYSYRKQGLPVSWDNGGKGGCSITERKDSVRIEAFSGAFALKAGESRSFRFSLLVTPLKPMDTDAHWKQRYHHTDLWNGDAPSLTEAARVGASVVNLHQGGPLNEYINYPFLNSAKIREKTGLAHSLGLKYKIYYTVRELSNRAEELWMLRSLKGEVLREDSGFRLADQFTTDRNQGRTGGPWLREHLVEGFTSAWHQRLPDGEYDCAVAMSGLSRWHNHYLEGLAWLVREDGLDGIYLDGIGYDRQIMKRVRKTLDSAGEGCLIDFHSGNNFEAQYGLSSPMNQYMELMQSIDSLWMGEGYDYEGQPPDYWLTEISGIPFGLMGDMLQHGGNPWRGMVFGMTCRYGWQQGGDPVPLWRFWDSFAMTGSRMHGWWSEGCPVTAGREDVKATAFIRQGRTLVAVASWATETVQLELAVDWAALELRRECSVIEAPAIEGFQPAGIYTPDGALTVEPGKGWLLIIREQENS